jgi:hypothetical protein
MLTTFGHVHKLNSYFLSVPFVLPEDDLTKAALSEFLNYLIFIENRTEKEVLAYTIDFKVLTYP